MYAEIILHRRVPSRFESFTYGVPDNFTVTVGQIVKVPFRNQVLAGIVRSLHHRKPAYPTKAILETSTTILAAWQMELAEWMAHTYASSFSSAIDLFIPEKIWNLGKEETKKIGLENAPAKLSAPSSSEASRTTLMLEKTPLPRKTFYNELVKGLPAESQALFLFPEHFFLEQCAPEFPQYHGELKEAEKAHLWNEVREGKITAIAGTRAAIFLPFKKLSLVVVDFEHNQNYTEKRRPNYHALEVAEKLAELQNARLIAISPSPRVETWHRAKKNLWTITEPHRNTASLATISTIDMADERRKHNYSLFAEKTVEKIAGTLARMEQVLLFINRKGEASALLCQDCGNVLRCPSCKNPFTLHSGNELKCHRCRTTGMVPTRCHSCRGERLKPLGAGTEGLEKEIKKIFGKAKVMRLEGGQKTNVSLQTADIIVATQVIEKPLNIPRLRLAVAVQPDNMFQLPDFRAEERAFQLLTSLQHLATDGELIIQTFMPDHRIFQSLAKNTPERFYEEEFAIRKSLLIPPFN